MDAEQIAAQLYEAHTRLAPFFGSSTDPATALEWADLPESRRALLTAVIDDLLIRRVIEAGPSLR